MMPWTTLAWTQVHHGQLPLWNPYSGLGCRSPSIWQSAPFGLPALVGYLVPVQYAYTVGIVVTVVVAGTGAYFLGRLLHLGVVGCAMAATGFELSGPSSAPCMATRIGVLVGRLDVRGGVADRARPARVRAWPSSRWWWPSLSLLDNPRSSRCWSLALVVFVAALLVHSAVRRGRGRSVDPSVLTWHRGGRRRERWPPRLALPGLQVFSGSLHSKTAGEVGAPGREPGPRGASRALTAFPSSAA